MFSHGREASSLSTVVHDLLAIMQIFVLGMHEDILTQRPYRVCTFRTLRREVQCRTTRLSELLWLEMSARLGAHTCMDMCQYQIGNDMTSTFTCTLSGLHTRDHTKAMRKPTCA
eukprot:gnl/TRDRNA2_/TRDRNA2_185835_c0_seq1.p1 gnl/TRDRNA2_/TRDRNA2_185835_c0~~gnl/TRDRNA2_/TRDRNA2_185835_c0_seq1.p1  ORF type:complete len:114 (-),score=1.62 gnl/TRDRNA2_/TRDRNA2_185835_c0_seq1:120-461(-)